MQNEPVIVITGASSGIGKACSKELVKLGWRLILCGRNEQNLAATAQEVGPERCLLMPGDLSEISNIPAFAESVRAIGPVRGLVCAAGISSLLPLSMLTPQKVEQVFSINTFATMALVRAFSSQKSVSPDGASFVLISSVSAHEGAKGRALYGASKGALEGFVPAAAAELVGRKIRLNIVVPGVVETEMTAAFFGKLPEEQRQALESSYPLGLGKPEDIADLIGFLVSDRSRWITGQRIIIDGGHLTRPL